jgi:hypothetical protein
MICDCGARSVRRRARYFDYHHSAADTLNKIDPNELAQDAAAIAALAWIVADAP